MEHSILRNRESPRYDLDSNGDTDESWQFVDYSSNGSGAASVGFLPSPSSGSLNGYAVVGYASTPSQPSSSPLPGVEMDQLGLLPPSSNSLTQGGFVNDTVSANGSGGFPHESFLTPQNYLFSSNDLMAQPSNPNFANDMTLDWQQTDNVDYSTNMNAFQLDPTDMSFLNTEGLQTEDNAQASSVLQWQTNQLNFSPEAISPENLMSWPSDKSNSSASPKSPSVKSETSQKSASLPIRKVKGSKIQKKKLDEQGKFLIMTPNSISAQAGRPNPFECFEAMRTTQRGRKGPLANATKENALQVRRQGACFCCRSRKVKCDTQRPCQHCTKLMTHVPQVVCWQFQDFLTNLFPDFIRGHLRKEEVFKFVSDNVEGFLVNGERYPCSVKLFSGPLFATTLDIDANFFTAKTCDVLQHWHLKNDSNGVDLQSNGSTPIGIDMSTGKKKEELRKKVKSYVQNIIGETKYAEQVTDSLKSTQLPIKILRIAQTYANKTNALSIYAMQYIMTRHLCLTTETIFNLQSSGLVPQNSPWVTPRVLARQLKALVDDLCMREMQNLFELFTKALKPKYRREWAPSLAAFLVLCLFMEAVETMTDNFVIAQNNINQRDGDAPQFKRSFALNMCTELENLPFKQFAYQFHNIYQTHSRDANSKAFNPLFDSSFQDAGELDEPAIELVESLKELYYGEDWQDIQYLVDDDILLNRGESPSCLDTSFLYSGRLVAKFLMSFRDEDAIFGSKI